MSTPEPPAYPALESRLSARLVRAVREPWRVTRRVRGLPDRLAALRRPVPHGLFAWSFFLPGGDARGCLHRGANLAMRGRWPVPVWLLYQGWLAGRWRRRFAAAETDRAVAQYGAAVEAADGISRAAQRRVVLDLARRYCMLPEEIYQFRLYRAPERALDYVSDNEAVGLHRMMNGRHHPPDADALQDKAVFFRRASAAGLPCVPILAVIAGDVPADPEALARLHPDGVFVKIRSGYRGIGAFQLQTHGGTLSGRTFEGRPLAGVAEAAAALAALRERDHVIVQPLLRSHPVLAAAATLDDAVFLRTMTRRTPAGGEILSAYLRLPMAVRGQGDAPARTDVLAGIDRDTGRIRRNPASLLGLFPQGRLLEDRAFQALGESTPIPFWEDICAQSLRAQREFDTLWGIGWDWVVTGEGPVLLEGNVYWSLRRAQEVAGGFAGVVERSMAEA